MKSFLNSLKPESRLPAYILFLSLGLFIVFLILMASPSDPKNAIFLGYSLERILLGGSVLLPSLTLLAWTWNLSRRPEQSLRLWAFFSERYRLVLWISLGALTICWLLIFLPDYRLGGLAGYVQRLYPVIGWLAVTGAVTSALILFGKTNSPVESSAKDRIVLRVGLISFLIFMLIAVVVMVTGLGIRYPADYWYGAGVPVLGIQVMVSLLVGVLIHLNQKRLDALNIPRLDGFIFIVIWIVTALFWAREPIAANYFMPDTADNIIYPYSDGATFDTGAQYALIGQGILNGKFFERALYSIFLVYLHMFVGQDFSLLMTAQAAVFAVLPALVFWIGRELHSRALGIAMGVLLAIRGVNAIIAAKWIDTASPKMALTDFPTAIALAVFLLLIIKWFKEPEKPGRLVWAGAVFALAFMLRSNVLTLLPAVLLLSPLFLRLNWKQFVLAGLLALLGLFAVTLPWELRNQSRGIPMYSMYYSRLITVLQYRYGIGIDAFVPTTDDVRAQTTPIARDLSRQRVLVQTQETCDSLPCSIANHFLHNLVTSVASMPTSLVVDDLWNTIKADTPYWKQDWNEGRVGTLGAVMIFFNLVIIALGVASIWKRAGVLTLLPLLVYVVYLFTNSLGLTSGGRYLAPVDWILYLYYIAGGLQIFVWLLRAAGFFNDDVASLQVAQFPSVTRGVLMQVLPSVAMILAFGMVLPASEFSHQPRYQTRDAESILTELEETGFLEQSGFSRAELTAFLSQPTAMIREGRALYPRYYPEGEGEQDRSTYYRYLDYKRLVFTLIGPVADGAEGVVIPGLMPPYSFHAGDVVVVGCLNTTYYASFIDAVVVFYTTGDGFVYLREPSAPLQCPLPEPK